MRPGKTPSTTVYAYQVPGEGLQSPLLARLATALRRSTVMANNPVIWFEIYVQNMERAKKFYESVFQVTLDRINSPAVEMWSFPMEMNQVGAGGALVRMEGVPSGGNSTLVYFSCADCAVEEKRVANNGGRIEKPKMSIGEYGFISLVYDTEGNMIGLHSQQ
jgi:predicted enzyme related to lactoylglutathione lyase